MVISLTSKRGPGRSPVVNLTSDPGVFEVKQ